MDQKLKSGLIWSIIEVTIKRMSDFLVKLVLARLLFPEDFGVIGMATVFTSFIQILNDAGMGPAIVQKKSINDKELNTVFWTNLIWSIFLYSTLSFLLAPLAAEFYKQPILIKIIPVLSISILTSALNTVHFSQLRRDLNFKKIALIRNFSSIVSGVIAIGLAFSDFGIWSIVANDVIAYIITVPLFYKATKWKPTFEWDKKILKNILSFGLYVTGSKIIINLIGNADYLFLGKWVGATAVGVYTLAFMMTNLVSNQITTMLDTVMFPFYSSIQDDKNKLKAYYLKLIGYYALFIYPIMITLFLFADIIVPFIFGEKWNEAIPSMKVLSIAVVIGVITTGYNLLFRSTGNPKYEFKIQQFTSIIIYLPCLIIGICFFGMIGAAYGILTSRILNFFVHQYVLKKYFEIDLKDIFSKIYKISIVCIISIFLVIFLQIIKFQTIYILFIYLFIMLFGIWFYYKNDIIQILKKKITITHNYMKILTIINSASMGGVEKTLLSCIKNMPTDHVKMTILCFQKGGSLENDFKKLGVEFIYIKKTGSIFFDFIQLLLILMKTKYDVIHSRFGFTSGGFILAARLINTKIFVSLHNTDPSTFKDFKKNVFLYSILKIHLHIHKFITKQFASKIIGHSKANLNVNFPNWKSKSKFYLIYNGVDFSSLVNDYETRSDLENFTKNSDFTILHIGSFRSQKNHFFLLDCFNELKPIEKNYKLIFLGTGGLFDLVKEKVALLGLNNNVFFAGFDQNIKKYFDQADLFFLPSLNEGLANVILESQYLKVPICVSDIAPLYESGFKDYHKYYFNPNDKSMTVNRLNKIIFDKKNNKLDDIIIKAKEYTNDNFSINSMIEALIKLYNEK